MSVPSLCIDRKVDKIFVLNTAGFLSKFFIKIVTFFTNQIK